MWMPSPRESEHYGVDDPSKVRPAVTNIGLEVGDFHNTRICSRCGERAAKDAAR